MAFGDAADVTTARSIAQSAPDAQVGLLADFCGSFENTLKSQANGAIQLANRLGANINETRLAVVDHATFGSSEWTAQLAGQAAALSVEFFAARKLGTAFQAARSESSVSLAGLREPGNEYLNATRLQSPVPKVVSSAGFGALLGGVLTPTSKGDDFWSERLRNSISGAVTFGTMTGVGAGLESLGKLGTGIGASTLRSGFVNNSIGGFAGGVTGEVSKSLMVGELPSTNKDYVQHVVQSGVEFGLVGLGSHALHRTASGIANLGEQRTGTDRTNAKFITDSLGLTKDPQTSKSQVDFKIISGASEFDRLHSELRSGADQAQAQVVVQQRLHGVLSDLLGDNFRSFGPAKSMLLSHGAEVNPALLKNSDLVATCSNLDREFKTKDVFPTRLNLDSQNTAVWLDKTAVDNFRITRNQNPNADAVMLGHIGHGPVEIQKQPLGIGQELDVNPQLKVLRDAQGNVYARAGSQSAGIWQKAQSGEIVRITPDTKIFYGTTGISHSYYEGIGDQLRPGGEKSDMFGYTVGKSLSGDIYLRADDRRDGVFVRRPIGSQIEITTADKFIHMGPLGTVEIRFAPATEVTARDDIRVNGSVLHPGNTLTFGRNADRHIGFPETDLSVSRQHGSVTRLTNGQLWIFDASSFGTYTRIEPGFRIAVNPGDIIGVLNNNAILETHEVRDNIGPRGARPLQHGSSPVTEPIHIGRTDRGILYVEDAGSSSGAWLKLPKGKPTVVDPNGELMLGLNNTRLTFTHIPAGSNLGPFQVGGLFPPIEIISPEPIAQPVSPVPQAAKPDPVQMLARRNYEPTPVAKPVPAPIALVRPVATPRLQPGNPAPPIVQPGHINTKIDLPQRANDPLSASNREYRVAPSGVRYTYRVETPPRDPAALVEYEKKLRERASAPIHDGAWFEVTREGTEHSINQQTTLMYGDINGAKKAASFIAGIIERKTMKQDEVGYSAQRLPNGKFAPRLNWNGFEGIAVIDPYTKAPLGVYGMSHLLKIPQ